MGRRALTAERFWARFDKAPGHGPNGDCWLWTGYIGPRGYGMVRMPGGKGATTVQRAALIFSGVPLAPGQHGCHHCDYPPCGNPDHLFAGTQKENSADMIAKGRAATGERNGLAKLTADDVLAMRRARANGQDIGPIARSFGVAYSTAKPAILGLTWKHVPMIEAVA